MKTRDQQIAEEVREECARLLLDCYECKSDSPMYEIDLDAIVASIPRPEPVAYRFYKEKFACWEYDEPDNRTAGQNAEPLYAAPVSAEPVNVQAAHMLISGALFDFVGWLTSRKQRLTLSSSDNAGPAVEAIQEFASMRDLNLDEAAVLSWQDAIAAAEQAKPAPELSEEKLTELWINSSDSIAYGRAIERELKGGVE